MDGSLDGTKEPTGKQFIRTNKEAQPTDNEKSVVASWLAWLTGLVGLTGLWEALGDVVRFGRVAESSDLQID